MRLNPALWWRVRGLRPLLRGPIVAARHRGLQAEDIILAEYPKSGGTWLALMLAEVLFGRPVDFDTHARFAPGVGRHRQAPTVPGLGGRLIRSHEPHRRDYRRSVYLVRHVADVAVSYYHWLSWLGIEPPPFQRFLPMFLRGEIEGYGSWQGHVESWLRDGIGMVHVVRYEDLRRDTTEEMRAVLAFLGMEAPDRALRDAIEDNTMDRMREKQERARDTAFRSRADGAHFVRRGAAGESRAWLGEQEFALVRTFAGPTLARLGYPLVPDADTGSPGP